jgi:3',5'-cyclic AMP phosphodiesterase CpdA
MPPILPGSPEESHSFQPFFFFHFGDPQIGVGPDGMDADAERFLQAVRQANALQPDFALMSGDMVDKQLPAEYEALDLGLKELKPPAKCVPGNHDVSGVEDLGGLANYRRRFGKDYYHFDYCNCAFICLNAMTLNTEGAISDEARQESQAQWDWLKETLDQIADQGREHTLLFLHVPPFVETEDEGAEYFNLPPEPRRRLLSWVRRYGIRHILCGHTHTTRVIKAEGFTIYTTGGTTGLMLDGGPQGYRIFKVYPGRVGQEFVTLDSPPARVTL